MNLIIDCGNTLTKIALFHGNEMIAFSRVTSFGIQEIEHFILSNPGIKNAVISDVRDYDENINVYLKQRFNTLVFSNSTAVPITNSYSTPETLGKDRLAAVVGAHHLFPSSDVLVIDAGTAITYDIISADGVYTGGGIAPGIAMRYKALHTFTGRLPLLDYYGDTPLVGNNTVMSIQSGVLNGAVAEMDGIITQYLNQSPLIKIIVTGGDYNYFDKRLKIKTFAAPNLVLEGLNLILEFNIGTH